MSEEQKPWSETQVPDEKVLELLGDFKDRRTRWSDLDGQLVWISLDPLGLPELDELPAQLGRKASFLTRIVGVESTGLWIDPWAYLVDIHQGELDASEHAHFFVPFREIRAVKARSARRDVLKPK